MEGCEATHLLDLRWREGVECGERERERRPAIRKRPGTKVESVTTHPISRVQLPFSAATHNATG